MSDPDSGIQGLQSRLLDFVPKGSSRATRNAKKALVKGVKEAFSRLAVGAAENNSLALAVASVKADLTHYIRGDLHYGGPPVCSV